MASGSAFESKHPIFIDKFEELDVLEFDQALLRELLEGPIQEESQGGGVGCLVEPMEVIESDVMMDGGYRSEHIGSEFNWYDDMMTTMMEMAPSLPCDEMNVWHVDERMEEMGHYNEDEIAYIGLWQD